MGWDVDFWGKNEGGGVKLQQLGRIGKKKTFKNVRKRSKIFKNIQKHSNFEWKRSKIFENIQKCVRSFEQKFITFLF